MSLQEVAARPLSWSGKTPGSLDRRTVAQPVQEPSCRLNLSAKSVTFVTTFDRDKGVGVTRDIASVVDIYKVTCPDRAGQPAVAVHFGAMPSRPEV